MSQPLEYYIGIDVGTGSVRAVLVGCDGVPAAFSTHDTVTYRDKKDARIFEQSTTNIWDAVCASVKSVMAESGVPKESVKGIGFDATCSLAVTDWDGKPICVTGGSTCGTYGDRNIILWADHRAEEEAALINSSGSVALNHIGGTMSLEMELPKILWLHRHMPKELFAKCMFFGLPDYLTYRATSSLTRSACSLVYKCSFVPPGLAPDSRSWDTDLFEKIGLNQFIANNFKPLGGALGEDALVMTAGLPVGKGLNELAATELGLLPGTPVGSGVIDAYAGWIGTVAARYSDTSGDGGLSAPPSLVESSHRVAAVAGTSTCYIVQTADGLSIPGVWGPYKDAILPGWWMNVGGQSSTGQLIDFIINTHPARGELEALAKEKNQSIFTVLSETLEALRTRSSEPTSLTYLTRNLHLYPDLHGNRSPLRDSTMKGSIMGLTLDSGLDDLAKKFHVTLEAISLQTRHIIDEMNANGHAIHEIFISGGQAKNALLVQLLSDICGMPVILPAYHSAAVVLGTAMLGRFAAEITSATRAQGVDGAIFQRQKDVDAESGRFGEELWNIMVQMTRPGVMIVPGASSKDKKILEAKYKIFRESIEIQRRWKRQIEEACN